MKVKLSAKQKQVLPLVALLLIGSIAAYGLVRYITQIPGSTEIVFSENENALTLWADENATIPLTELAFDPVSFIENDPSEPETRFSNYTEFYYSLPSKTWDPSEELYIYITSNGRTIEYEFYKLSTEEWMPGYLLINGVSPIRKARIRVEADQTETSPVGFTLTFEVEDTYRTP